jgi:long-chain acyl-CoA synthetase
MPSVPDTLTAQLAQVVASCPDQPALTIENSTLTYGQLSGAIDALAASLAQRGVGPGQRVAILFPNCPQFIISYFATLRVGATVVPLHCLQAPAELAYIVSDAGAETLIGLDAFDPVLDAIRETCPAVKQVIVSGQTTLGGTVSLEALLASPAEPPATVPARPDDVVVLIYTSGTTGRPKGAMLTHDNLLFDAMACREVIGIGGSDVLAAVLPLFHSFGATVCMLLPLLCGSHVVLMPRFAPVSVMEALERHRCTVFAGVPSMYTVMLQMRVDRTFDLTALRICVSGGAALPVEVLHRFEERFGVLLIEGYGPTEASPVVTVNPVTGGRRVGTVGPPIPGVRVSIRGDDFTELPAGAPGEVCVAGRNVMAGYWNDPVRTAETVRDGWLLTGDIGVMDSDGFLSIVDRKKDMVIVGGMNVYPREVEDIIYQLPEVAEAAVIGIPSRLRGEDVRAVVALREGATLDAQAIINHCKAHLANYKVPRGVEFRDELPKSGTGKILKRELRG